MAEQLGEKCSLMKRRIEKLNSLKGEDEMNFGSLDDYNQIVLNQNYKKLQDSNKLLNFELNDLRIKLTDAESDLRLLRDKISKFKKQPKSDYSDNIIDHINEQTNDKIKNQNLIEQIEKLKMKNKELEKDLKLHLDEKEDLIKSRNNYIQKVDRLNENLNSLMKSGAETKLTDDKLLDISSSKSSTSDLNFQDKFLDIDCILSENNFLKERIQCLEEDKKLNQDIILKYKHALDKTNSNKKNFFEFSNLTNNLTKKSASAKPYFTNYLNQDILSTKEVQFFIASNNLDNLELNEATLTNLRKLVLALFESLTDKSAAVNLAKTNNKLLGKRINDLETKLKEYQNREKNKRVETFKINLNNSEKIDKLNETELNDKQEIDENENIKNFKKLDDDLINLPVNLQKLVEQELEKLKDNV